MSDAALPSGSQRIDPGSAKQHPRRPERHQAHNIKTRMHPAIGQDRGPVANGLGNAWQGSGAGDRSIELSAAMIGHDDPVGPGADSAACVIRIQHALQDQRP